MENFLSRMADVVGRADSHSKSTEDYYKLIIGILINDGKTSSTLFQTEFVILLDNINKKNSYIITKENSANLVEANRIVDEYAS